MSENLEEREERLQKRLEKLNQMEEEIRVRENSLAEKEKARKQIVLRLSSSLWADLTAWAEEDFRSLNGQIEYLLADAVRKKKGKKEGGSPS